MVAPRARPGRGQHFLDPRIASEIVRQAGVRAGDLVVEIGAGDGALTHALASIARRVIAVELDPRLVSRLERRFARADGTCIVHGDALTAGLPDEPFRVVGNIPFSITTALCRRLFDDPFGPLVRADLIVQREVAVKRTAVPPRNLLTLSWTPWWAFERGRSLPAHLFHPRPPVDAALLTVMRRRPPLLTPECRSQFVHLLGRGFVRAGEPLPQSLRDLAPTESTRRLQRRLELPARARPVDLTTEQWVALFVALNEEGWVSRPSGGRPTRGGTRRARSSGRRR